MQGKQAKIVSPTQERAILGYLATTRYRLPGRIREIFHIPSDLVVDHWTSDGESSSHRDVLLLHDVWTTSNRLSGTK